MQTQGNTNHPKTKGGEQVPDSEAKRNWMKANTTVITMKLNNKTDSDILEALQGKQKQTEIKRLLRIALQSEAQK